MKKTVLVALLLIAGATGAKGSSCDFDSQVRALALNIYHEARDQGIKGMQLVGEVTLNRVGHSMFPDSVCEVVFQPNQFSWTGRVKNLTPKEKDAWFDAQLIAWGLLHDTLPRYTLDATHYLNPDRVSRLPRWARTYTKVTTWKDHVFYKVHSP